MTKKTKERVKSPPPFKTYILNCKEENVVCGIYTAENRNKAYAMAFRDWENDLGIDFITFKSCYYCNRFKFFDDIKVYLDGRDIPEEFTEEDDYHENRIINFDKLKEYLIEMQEQENKW